MQLPYINIHTHHKSKKKEISLLNIPAYLPLPTEDILYKTAGIHPWNTDDEEIKRQLVAIEELCNKKQLLAIGECGIDKTKGLPIAQQISIFEQQIRLAEQFDIPLIIHAVKAQEEIFKLRKKYTKNTWILHGFKGSTMMAKQYLNMQIKTSFGVDILKNIPKISVALNFIPLSEIYLETDDSHIAIEEVYKKVAEIKEIKMEEVVSQIYTNFERDFIDKVR
jgi:TatD DNase family protein